ncbi:transcriptional regulator [Streptomyces longisporoflavus]|uniref:ArsR/SmtB family transcription factor n=1 Tax=Streptomyces longisporoflavus TaxID=28044 RepID=UPI00167D2CBE|nr:winged helix-turn-helix domain-containing protein [Streptomyces longisporoflavus]GGV31239.1 transcriptional regulator [Streptomyces longisporoflavus]
MTDGVTEPESRKIHTLTPHSLRGLAHPLRIQLLTSLRKQGAATASQLAERLGESSGATSYHLRQLAAHGFVEDAPGRGKGRERWWQSTHQGTRLDESLMADPDPTVRGAVAVYLHEVAAFHASEVSTWIGTQHDWSPEWTESADISDYTLRLTPELTAELNGRINELIESYRPLAVDESTPDSARVRLHTHVFPTHYTE